MSVYNNILFIVCSRSCVTRPLNDQNGSKEAIFNLTLTGILFLESAYPKSPCTVHEQTLYCHKFWSYSWKYHDCIIKMATRQPFRIWHKWEYCNWTQHAPTPLILSMNKHCIIIFLPLQYVVIKVHILRIGCPKWTFLWHRYNVLNI